MPRIVIIGNSGGGKTTLAKMLARDMHLVHVEIDTLLWTPNWALVPPDTFESRHRTALAEADWVIDGLGRQESIAMRIQRATHIVLIDMPLWVHFWLAAERQIALVAGRRVAIQGGFCDPPPLQSLFRTIFEVDLTWMPEIRNLCATAERNGARVFRVQSLEDLNALPQILA